MQSKQSEVPPELAPYYQPSRRAEFRRAALLILPFVAVLAIIGGLIWGGWWLTHHTTKPQSSISNGHTEENGSPNVGSLPTYLQPGATPKKPTPKPKPTPIATEQPAPSKNLINTGPGVMTALLPCMSAILAATLFELRQVRRSVRE